LGVLTDVIQNGAQDLYEVELESKKKILIPVVDAFVLEIDMVKRRIKVELPEGLTEL
jgi:16S rRNA processing protein RimM